MKVHRGDLHDVYVDGGRSAVMVGEQVLVLSEVATAIIQAVPERGSADVSDVAARVEAELGAPEPPHTALGLVRDHVEELTAHHVLVLDEPAAAGTTSPDAVRALRDAVRHVLSGDPERWRLPPDVTGAGLVAAAEQHHLVSFVERHRDRLDLPPGAGATLYGLAAQRAAAVDVLAGELATALRALERADVRALAVKGLALAVQAHGDAAARGAGDLDLLVAPADVAAAHDALTRAGWTHDPGYPSPGASWAWRHFLRTGHELSLDGASSVVDLHWQLAPAHHTFPPFDVLWERREVVVVAGTGVPTLSPYDALVHSAGHAARDEWRWMRSLVDVHLLASEPAVWRSADRPLRPDELLSVALATRMFGMPEHAPRVVREADLEESLSRTIQSRQEHTDATHDLDRFPGAAMITRVQTLRRTGSGLSDAIRQFGFSVLPPWSLADETSPHASVAVPRALWRRGAHVARRLRHRP